MEYLNENSQSVSILRNTEQALKEKRLLYIVKKTEVPKANGIESNGSDLLGKRGYPENGHEDGTDETKRQRLF
jgi:hypothetical protein